MKVQARLVELFRLLGVVESCQNFTEAPALEGARMSHVRVLNLILIVPSLVLVACDEGRSAGATAPLVRDSSGITIVENVAPRWRAGEEWRLSPDPLVIGSLDGPPGYQFFRVDAAIRLTDGRILVGDQGSGELRLSSGNGEYLQTLAKQAVVRGNIGILRQSTSLAIASSWSI
ncbi:MAG: hypothetical protein GEU90_04530 [Gemmatimonas sp.]|nr:hypothetical protein [Gemmatimonas sp.]